MKIEEGEVYNIKFVKPTTISITSNANSSPLFTEDYEKGNTLNEVEMVELDEKAGTVTLYFEDRENGEDTFARAVPIDSFKAVKKMVVTWEGDEDE